MKHTAQIAIKTVTCFLAIAAFAGCVEEDDNTESFVIGSIHPLSGPLSPYGPGINRAIDLAVEEINSAGGILGKELIVVHKDSGSNTSASVSSVDELTSLGVMGIIGARGSTQSLAILEKAGEYGIPQISAASTATMLSTEEYGTFFRTVSSDWLQGQALAKLARGQGARSVAVIHVEGIDGEGLADVFTQFFEDATHEVTDVISYRPSLFDYTQVVDDAFAGGSQSLVLIATPGDGATIVNDIVNRGYQLDDVFLSDGLKTQDFVFAAGGDFVEGWLGTAPLASGPVFETFAAAYQAKYGRRPRFSHAAAYDAVYILALALQKAHRLAYLLPEIRKNIPLVASPDGIKVRPGQWLIAAAALSDGQEVDYDGASGDVDMDDSGEVISKYGKWRINNGLVEDVGIINLN